VSLVDKIEKSKALSNWIGDRVEGLELPHDPKFHVPGICFQVGLTHHTAIITLMEQGRTASALALIRPLMECYLRGAWVYHVADADSIDKFLSGKKDLKASEIVAELEERKAFDQKRLSAIKTEIWSDLCDYTHCGGKTISAHYAGDEIRATYEEPFLERALLSADSWGLLIGTSLVVVAGQRDLAEEFLTKSKSIGQVAID
jgi:hypothetical protein